MPTVKGREELRQLAIDCFNSQDWPNKELIIIEGEGTIGGKLNIACKKASGDILIRWDDDDWSASTRITRQIQNLDYSKALVTGFSQIYFWDEIAKRASSYTFRGTDYCLGTSLCFKREYWQSNPFLSTSKGEDLAFQLNAKNMKSIYSVPADQLMVARLHGSNTSSSKTIYPKVDVSKLPTEFFRRINV